MQIVDKLISIDELKTMSEKMYGGIVKAVIDIEKEIIAIDAQLHSDLEMLLLEEYESKQEYLWGINFHPDEVGTPGFLEFDSMINIRPNQGNRTRGVNNPQIQEKIKLIVNKLVAI